MSKDQAYGGVVLIGSVAVAVFYLAALFPTHFGLPAWLAWWAIALPVISAVLALLTICTWIGWVMLTTPPPPPLEETASQPTESKTKENTGES